MIHERKYPELAWLLHVPNGGLRNVVVAARLKAQGTRKGFPDIMLPVARYGYNSLAIELKRQKKVKSTISKDQKEWIDFLNSAGWYAVVCYGAEEAIKILKWYLAETPEELDY